MWLVPSLGGWTYIFMVETIAIIISGLYFVLFWLAVGFFNWPSLGQMVGRKSSARL